MNERPAFDWADQVATECLCGVHTLTAGQAATLIAVALRNAHAKGFAEAKYPPTLFQRAMALTPEERAALNAHMRAFASTLVKSVRSPAELRKQAYMQQHRVGD